MSEFSKTGYGTRRPPSAGIRRKELSSGSMGAPTHGGWPFTNTTKPHLEHFSAGPTTNAKQTMKGVYSFGHLETVQSDKAAAPSSSASNSNPSSASTSRPYAPRMLDRSTTAQCTNMDTQYLWNRNAGTAADTQVYMRPQSGRPQSGARAAPELEYSAPVPRSQRPRSARSYYHHQGYHAPSLKAITNATRKETQLNITTSRKCNVAIEWE